MRKRLKLLWILLCCHSLTYAGGFQFSSQGTKALGMGGSLSGHAFDASTVFFNPGGMTALDRKTYLNAGFAALMPRTSFLGMENQQEDDDSPLSIPYYIYVSTKLKDERFSVGISINTPFTYTSQWKDDWTGRFISQTFRIRTLFIQPTAAYKINDRFSVGAGPVIAHGSIYSTRALPYTITDNTESSLELNGNATSIAANIGFYYSKDKLTLGLTWRSGVKLKIDGGDADFHDVPSSLLLNGTYPASTTFSTDLNLPSVYSLAGGYTLNEKILITFGFNYTQWDVFKSLDYNFKEENLPDITSTRNYKNTLTFRGGIEAKAFKKFTLRGGIGLDESPIPDQYMSPDIPDDNRVIISGGITWHLKENISLDGSFMFENVKEHRESDNIPYNFNGTYNSFIYTAGIGAQFTF